jgi:hypothetical protein
MSYARLPSVEKQLVQRLPTKSRSTADLGSFVHSSVQPSILKKRISKAQLVSGLPPRRQLITRKDIEENNHITKLSQMNSALRDKL